MGPLVLLAALHAACTTWAFRRWRSDAAFEPILATVGVVGVTLLLALVGLRGPTTSPPSERRFGNA